MTSRWVGTDDTPTTGFWSPGNSAGTDMSLVAAYAYAADGHLTAMTLHPGGGAAPRRTEYAYDWRGRPVIVKDGAEAAEAAAVNRPLAYTVYDNLGRPVSELVFDGDGVAPADADGVPDRLRARTDARYDDRGQAYRTEAYRVDQATGVAAPQPDVSQAWFDARGLVVKVPGPDGRRRRGTTASGGRPRRS